MLAILSDLHLQQTAADCLRYRDGDTLRQIGVRRNVKASAFERFVEEVLEVAAHRHSTEIHLVLAGDIFELHRAPSWFFGPEKHVRPTDPVGEDIPENPLRRRILEILNQLETDPDHAKFWAALQQFARDRADGVPQVTVHYLPGNHDRLANAWPSVRQQVRRLLGMDPLDTRPFPTRLDFTGTDLPDYGVRVRHGHEYDPANFAGAGKTPNGLDRSWQEYLAPTLGDYFTVDVVMRLALAFRARYALGLRGAGDAAGNLPAAADMRRLYLALTEFDDVRPASLLTRYLAAQMSASQTPAFQLLKPILRDVLETAVASPLFRSQVPRHVPRLLLRLLPGFVKHLAPALLERIVRAVSQTAGDDVATPAQHALDEFRLGRGFRLVVAGHTHQPAQVPLVGPAIPPEAMYLGSGTWRTSLPFGVGGFGRLRAYTNIFCYNTAERERRPEDGRAFEAWTGHSAAGTLGPYDEIVEQHSPAPAGVLQLRFDQFEVISGENELNGTELRVQFGVDDQACRQEWKGVKPGDRLWIRHPPIPLDPDLDGDLWFHGEEVDWGQCPLDYDDPLPWALEPLPRQEPRGQFLPGPHVLRILGRGVGGVEQTEFLLRYSIAPA